MHDTLTPDRGFQTGAPGAPGTGAWRGVRRYARRLGWRGGAVVTLVVAAGMGLIGLGWWGGAAGAAAPAEGSADAGFVRDMIVHHDQAVTMAFVMRDRSSDSLMDAIAIAIVLTQLEQGGMMRGWLDVWELPRAGAGPSMAWMDHPVEGLMPGLATSEEMQRLRTLPIAEAEVLFLRLMIRHHVSGVEMAQAGLARVETELARELAAAIIPVQFAEIGLMRQELIVRGEPEEPVLDASGMGDGGHEMDGMEEMPGHEMGASAPGKPENAPQA